MGYRLPLFPGRWREGISTWPNLLGIERKDLPDRFAGNASLFSTVDGRRSARLPTKKRKSSGPRINRGRSGHPSVTMLERLAQAFRVAMAAPAPQRCDSTGLPASCGSRFRQP